MSTVFEENMLNKTAWTSRMVVDTPSRSSALMPLNLCSMRGSLNLLSISKVALAILEGWDSTEVVFALLTQAAPGSIPGSLYLVREQY